MKKYTLISIILLMISLIAWSFTWLLSHFISSPPSKQDASNSPQKPPPPLILPKVESPRPPLPREVEWSVLSKQLVKIEKQYTLLMTDLLPKLPPLPKEVENHLPSIEHPAKPPSSSQVSWAQVGKQLIELEKQREHITILFTERETHETSQP